jgi:hypothetical protein
MTRWIHLGLAVMWIILVVPGVLLWKESILFVILLSLYANIEASFAAYLSAPKKQPDRKRLRSTNISYSMPFGRVTRRASAKRFTSV